MAATIRLRQGLMLLAVVAITAVPEIAAGQTGGDNEKNAVKTAQGMLDCVFCIDNSGSMEDDIQSVQKASDDFLAALSDFARTSDFSLQVGVVTYTRHTDENWLWARQMSPDIPEIRANLLGITIASASAGAGGNEDMFGALAYAMDEAVGGRSMNMGWREGAAKIIIIMGDEPPDDPDWEGRNLDQIALMASNLDPVHMYPLLMTSQAATPLDPTTRAMRNLADATDGQVMEVENVAELPNVLISTVKVAVKRHANEVWRRENPPLLLYGTILALCVIIGLVALGLVLRAAVFGKTPESIISPDRIPPAETGGPPNERWRQ